MLDVNELFFNSLIGITFIEPYPGERLLSLMKERDQKNTTVISENIEKISLSIFEKLEKGDILFIDSTHVVKTGSDVNYILFEISSVLKKGVLIHFHDIHHPFEYPKKMGFGWIWLE